MDVGCRQGKPNLGRQTVILQSHTVRTGAGEIIPWAAVPASEYPPPDSLLQEKNMPPFASALQSAFGDLQFNIILTGLVVKKLK